LTNQSLPVVRSLADDFSLSAAFVRLVGRGGCLWLDSASPGPLISASASSPPHAAPQRLGRYSFLTADPIAQLIAAVGDDSPWDALQAWCRELPGDRVANLPPFQGGIAGLIGYEAATWLESSVAPAAIDDFPTPAISLGLYDWTIAVEHSTGRSWIISQGLGATTPADRYQRACDRVDQVQAWLAEEPMHVDAAAGNPASGLQTRCPDGYVPTDRPRLWSNFSGSQYRSAVSDIIQRIKRGDSFQVNLAQRLLAPATCSAVELYLRLREFNAAPYGGYYGGTDVDGRPFEVLSSSPEGFLKIRDGRIETRPIKGTVRRTGDPAIDRQLATELQQSVKDRAENTMIVDLMRNDLSRVCRDESIRVGQLCELEQYEHVQHLVSVVQGDLEPGDMSPASNSLAAIQACFPGGSVTGAPKVEAMRTIAELEPHRRGPYCGSLGYISCGGDADFNILIRTITAADGYWQIPVGGGVTARSLPTAEELETWIKSAGMLRAVLGEEVGSEILR
jgi:para-aminobenzoate synthetase component 1